LYKYLSAERVGNVLEGGTVRFTPLMNTNDTFEIRSTFDQLAGPKFRKMLGEQMDVSLSEDSVKQMTADLLKEHGLDFLVPELALKLAAQHFGQNFMEMLRTQMQTAVDTMLVPHFNDPKNIESLLEKLGRELLCFSLSERMDVAPMWAHYADNNGGFVVAFDTEHEWFQRRKDGKNTRLQKVTYFDGKVEEPLANVQAALISKTTDWEYEREWRLYVKEDQVDKTVGDPTDPIHLLDFPPDAVDRVILGPKTREGIAQRNRNALAARYPNARLVRAVPNRTNHTYDELDP
ncbi:MAG: DUF2971 domain-containing protein, partial [Pseudoruegeria sp.]